MGSNEIKKSKHENYFTYFYELFHRLAVRKVNTNEWCMRGEITADKRPINSVMAVEIALSWIDFFQRPIKENTAKNLNNLIKRRISVKKFDDVVCLSCFSYLEQ